MTFKYLSIFFNNSKISEYQNSVSLPWDPVKTITKLWVPEARKFLTANCSLTIDSAAWLYGRPLHSDVPIPAQCNQLPGNIRHRYKSRRVTHNINNWSSEAVPDNNGVIVEGIYGRGRRVMELVPSVPLSPTSPFCTTASQSVPHRFFVFDSLWFEFRPPDLLAWYFL